MLGPLFPEGATPAPPPSAIIPDTSFREPAGYRALRALSRHRPADQAFRPADTAIRCDIAVSLRTRQALPLWKGDPRFPKSRPAPGRGEPAFDWPAAPLGTANPCLPEPKAHSRKRSHPFLGDPLHFRGRTFLLSISWIRPSPGPFRPKLRLKGTTMLNTQTGPYIGDSDAATLCWLRNFSQRIGLNPESLGLTEADAAKIASLTDNYEHAYDRAQAPNTRTSPIIEAKDAARSAAEAFGRSLAMRIKANPQVNNGQKLELGIHVNDPTRTPIGAPETAPILKIMGANNSQHTLQFSDRNTPASHAKPQGVTHMLLFAEIADRPTGHEDNLHLIAAVTRNPHRVKFNYEKHAGKTALYRARWLTAKGLMGPWSAGVSMTVPTAGATGSQEAATSKGELSLAA